MNPWLRITRVGKDHLRSSCAIMSSPPCPIQELKIQLNLQWKDWQQRNTDFLWILSWFFHYTLQILPSDILVRAESHSVWSSPAFLWTFILLPLEGIPFSVSLTYKIVDGCHWSEKLLNNQLLKQSDWREKRSEKEFLSSSALVSKQVDPTKAFTFLAVALTGSCVYFSLWFSDVNVCWKVSCC